MKNYYNSMRTRKLTAFNFLQIFWIAIMTISSSFAQVTNYGFSQESTTYSPITGGTAMVLLPTATAAWDSQIFHTNVNGDAGFTNQIGAGFPIGFNFNYNGQVFDRFSIGMDGFIKLGSGASYTAYSAGGTSLSSTTANTDNIIVPFGNDLIGGLRGTGSRVAASPTYTLTGTGTAVASFVTAGMRIVGTGIPAGTTVTSIAGNVITMSVNATSGSTSATVSFVSGNEIRYETTGAVGSRELIVQWSGVSRFSGFGDNLNFQIRISETTDLIRFAYNSTASSSFTTSSTVNTGIKGNLTPTLQYSNRLGTGATAWTNSTPGTAPNAGIIFQGAAATGGSIVPPNALRFVWTPPVPCSGTPTAGNSTSNVSSACSGNNFLLSLTGNVNATGLQYQWQSATVIGGPYIDISGATTLSYSVTNVQNSAYYRCIVTCTASTLSSNSVPVNVAVTSPSYATIPLTESFENTWLTACVASPLGQDAPSANWRSIAGADPDASWRADNTTTVLSGWASINGAYSPLAQNGSRSARFHSYNTFPAGTQGMLDLFVNLSPTGNKQLSFWYITPNTGIDQLEVLLSEDGGATFTAITTTPPMAAPATAVTVWTNVIADLSSTSATAIIRFRGTGDNGNSDIGLDNVVVSQPCTGTPNTPVASTSSSTLCFGGSNVNLNASGVSAGSGITYQWQSATNSAGPYSNISGATTVGYTAVNVTAATWYKLITTCTASTLTSESNVINVTPGTAITTIPYTENFNTTTAGSLPACWQANLVSGTNNWNVGTVTNASEITSNFDGNFAYKLYNDSETLFVSPAFNFNAIGSGNVELDFQMHRRTPAHVSDILTFYVNTQPNLTGATLLQNYPSLITGTSVATAYAEAVTAAPANGWYNYKMTIPTSFNTAPAVYLIARGVTAGGFSSYALAFDDFRLRDALLSKDNFEIVGFKVYPNPTNSILNLEYISDITNVTITNMLGQVVVSKKLNASSAQIDMSNLTNGIYLVKVEAGNVSKTIKVFKK